MSRQSLVPYLLVLLATLLACLPALAQTPVPPPTVPIVQQLECVGPDGHGHADDLPPTSDMRTIRRQFNRAAWAYRASELGDVISTRGGLLRGARELNPILAPFVKCFPAFVAVRLLVGELAIARARRTWSTSALWVGTGGQVLIDAVNMGAGGR